MEGVGARLGRSSTRYGPATVFTGPVRKWKKKWVHVSPSTKKDNNNTASAAASVVNGGGSNSDGSNGSHLLLYKWAPLSQNGNGNSNGNEDGNKSESNSPSDDSVTAATAAEDPPRRRFKYVPIAVLEEQKKEITEIEDDEKIEEDEKIDEDNKVEQEDKVDEDKSVAESSEMETVVEEKPDRNDVPMEDTQNEEKIVQDEENVVHDEEKIAQDEEKVVRQDLNESTVELGLNLNANDEDAERDPKDDKPLEE
ncbi:PREDICTED: uncharacterized protein LOC104718082 isoform X2 [Camelina sativa]|uniref:Uncharacterized protein LOC104718082 isoform X2 n=1 Tax=Camelina sativa TaxID=90675 RepID=A0ABM0U0H2_CAMSA|nr:PREDICTED: uncharacterized protein LOC104718082 isoform X2 [Camelina sativa]